MATVVQEDKPDRESGFERVQKASYRPARLIGLLLILQAVGLAACVALQIVDLSLLAQNGRVTAHVHQTTNDFVSLLFVPSIVLALLAALSLLVVARRGWLLAAFSQGLCLAVCIWLYSTEVRPIYIYPIMASGIVLILYLNSRTVRMLFRSESAQRRRDRRV